MFQLLLIIFNFIFLISGQQLIDCNFNQSISLNSGQWFRYESVDFPKSLSLGPSNCGFNINMSSTTQLWITPVNAFLNFLGIYDWNPINNAFSEIDTNTKIQTYLTKGLFDTLSLIAGTNVDSSKWYGFQTVGIAVDSFFGCPFNGMPITLTDSKTIIPIASTYYSLNSNETKYLPKTQCTWNFQTTDDYQFKFVYRYSKFSLNETMFAQINGEEPKNITYNYDIGEAEAQYFDGKNLTFQYSAPQRIPMYYFYAVITVVKKTPTVGNCNNDTYDLVNGYSNFETCSTNYKQDSMTQTRIKVDLAAERCCDKLTIESGNATFTLMPNMIVNVDPHIESYNINFKTDGSIVQGGYKLSSVNYSCKNVSHDYIVPCNGTTIAVGYENGYCNNMFVSYNIIMEKYCTSDLNWEFTYNLRENSNDKIVYYIDNATHYVISNSGGMSSKTSGPVPFKIEFTSNMDTDSLFTIGNWWWNFNGYSSPSFPKINYNLNSSAPSLHFSLERLRTGQELTVTVDSQYNLEMYITTRFQNNLTNFLFFESSDHSGFVGLLSNTSLFIIDSNNYLATKYQTQSKVLIIQQVYGSYSVSEASVYFRIAPNMPPDCTNNNVYRVPEDYGNLTFPVSASETCQYSIIAYGYSVRTLGIESVSTNTSDLVQVTGGSFNQILPYFNFSDSTANSYKNLILYGSVFNFVIPKNAQTIISSGTHFNGGAYNATQRILFLNEINIITSPNYGEVYSDHIKQTFLTTVNSSFEQSSFLLSIVNQNVSSSANFYIQGYGNNNIDIKSQNSPLWINSSSFTVVYYDSVFSQFLISYQLVGCPTTPILSTKKEGGLTTPIPSTTTQRNNASKNFNIITFFVIFAVKLSLMFLRSL